MAATIERRADSGAANGALRPPWTRRRIALTATAVGLGLAVVWGWGHVGMSIGALFTGFGDIVNLLGRMFPPRFVDTSRVIELAWETLLMALLGTVLAVALSIPVAFLAAQNTSPNRVAYVGARAVITMARAVPDLIFALIFVRALGIGPLPGILALGLHSIGMIGKLFADAIEQVDEGPRDALRSTGAGRLQELSSAVVPQVLPSFIAVGLYRLDINLRVSVILGIVGAGGIGFELQSALRSLVYDRAMGIVIVIAIMVIAVEFASSAIRQSIIGREAAGVVRGARQTDSLGARMLGKTGDPDVPAVTSDAPGGARPEPATVVTQTPTGSLRPPWTTTRVLKTSYLVLLGGLVLAAFLTIDISPVELFTSVPEIIEISTRLFPPDFTTAWDAMKEGMIETVAIGLVSTAIGVVFMAPFAFLSARNIAPNSTVFYVARSVLVVLRSIPELILAVIFVAAMGLGPVPGVLALAVGTVGFLAKLMADSLEEIDDGPREAVNTTGATRLQETASSVVPQAMPAFVANALYALDINIRTSTILGIVGGGGIGFLLFNSIKTLNLEVTGAIIIMIFGVVYAIELLAGWIRKLLL